VPRGDVPAVLAASDVALVLLRPTPLFDTVLPSKMFEAMAAACPVILGVRGEAKDVLRDSGAGIAVEPGSPPELARAVSLLAGEPEERRRLGEAGRRFVSERFNHDALAARYLEALAELVDGRGR